MANELHTFTGNEVIATELPELLNQNFNYIQDNSLATVNGVEKDENNNVDVTFLTSQVIPTNSDLNNFRESGEYTRELDTIVVANSPTEKPFFLTVLASENSVKQVVTEIDRKDPMTFTRTLSGANWSPWVEGGVDIGIWKSEETVKVGDVRFLKGRENAGYILECVTAGTTGENQPVISEEDVENAEGLDINDLNGVVPIEKGGTGATTAEQARNNLGITTMESIFDLVYPIGSLYWSKNATDPGTLFGGTWTRVKDKFILAAGDTYAQGTTGGAATVALTTAQLPAHSHTRGTMQITGTGLRGGQDGTCGGAFIKERTGQSNGAAGPYAADYGFKASNSWSGSTSSVGSGSAHNNMPPYVTYYCWERTA